MAKKKTSTKKSGGPDLSGATRVAVFCGKEGFLQSQYIGQLREALAGVHGEVDTIRFDGVQIALAEVLDECRTLGLMQQHKLVVVENADQLVKEENRPLIERYVRSPAESATLVLRCERWYKGKLDALIEQVGVIVKCDEVSAETAAWWAMKRCEKRYGAVLEPRAAQMLVERVGTDLGRIDTEVAKLALSVLGEGGGGTARESGATGRDTARESSTTRITPEAVVAMVGQTREEEAWAIQETLLGGDARANLSHLRTIMEASRRDAHIPLSWAMADLARKLHAASRGLREGVHPREIGTKLKLWPEHRREAVLSTARRVSPERLAELLKDATEADMKQKTGFDPKRTLEGMAMRFAEVLGGGESR